MAKKAASGGAREVGREDLAAAVLAGDRGALARAITLVESTRTDHREAARALLAEVLPRAGGAARLGVSGAPGVGKSTFIECFGLHLIDQGHRLAVLAVDPSSTRGGGSILGDKTRMGELARSDRAFIRPSPSGGTPGGVARRTREALLLCEAAGFDVVLVETVGVGQSETAVADMVDTFLLLIAPGAGDELQGIKRGIVELAELIVVNKADGELTGAAGRVAADYRAAVGLLRPPSPEWEAQVLLVSALEDRGIDAVWRAARDHRSALGEAAIAHRRAEQARAWMWQEVTEGLTEALRGDARVAELLPDMEARVTDGTLAPGAAAARLLAAFRGEPEG